MSGPVVSARNPAMAAPWSVFPESGPREGRRLSEPLGHRHRATAAPPHRRRRCSRQPRAIAVPRPRMVFPLVVRRSTECRLSEMASSNGSGPASRQAASR